MPLVSFLPRDIAPLAERSVALDTNVLDATDVTLAHDRVVLEVIGSTQLEVVGDTTQVNPIVHSDYGGFPGACSEPSVELINLNITVPVEPVSFDSVPFTITVLLSIVVGGCDCRWVSLGVEEEPGPTGLQLEDNVLLSHSSRRQGRSGEEEETFIFKSPEAQLDPGV